jgi:two-component system NarL family sensor kinase
MTRPAATAADTPNAVRDLVDPDRELALLRRLIKVASSGPSVEPLAAAAARMITAATGTDVCFVHVFDEAERSLTLAGATAPFDSQVGKICSPLGSGIAGWVASHREPVVISHGKEADPRYLAVESLRWPDFTSMVSVPMETDPGGLVGVLEVHTLKRREFTARDVELLHVIGQLLAGALHQARLHRQVVARQRAHENFAEQVIQAQEIERRRLAADIHDGISQRLITLSYRLDAARQAVGNDPGEIAEQLEKAGELVELTLQEARAAIHGLRPPVLDDLGLSGGLASLARSIPRVDLDVELAAARLPEHIELALYRIAQECLQNMVKHARATAARLTFSVDGDAARLEIVDNGVGFDTFDHPLGGDEMGGYGLLSMAERAELVGGRLNIRSRPGSGTAVTATIPLPCAVEYATVQGVRRPESETGQPGPEHKSSGRCDSALRP